MGNSYFFESTTYWSEGDERAHFEWLERIRPVRNVQGEGRRLFLEIDEDRLDADGLRELEAIYRRYEGDASQLAALKDKITT